MADAQFDFSAIEQSITNSGLVRDYMDSISGDISTFLSSCDTRVLTYFADDFTTDLRSCRRAFNTDHDNMNGFGNWLSDTYQDLLSTNNDVIEMSDSLSQSNSTVSSTVTATGPGDSQSAAPLDLSHIVGSIETVTAESQSCPATSLTFINPEEFSKLPPEVQDAVKAALEKVGYSEDEIAAILNGETGVRTCVVDAVTSALETAIAEHPEIRDTIIDLYGFDPFDENGKPDPQLVAAMLLIDAKNPNDEYDIIKLLHDQYGIDLVDPVQLSQLSGQLETALASNQELRAMILAKYGFDIFNPDGTVNESLLALAMLMDGADPNDDFNLVTMLQSLKSGTLQKYVTNDLQATASGTVTTTGLTAVGAGLGGSSSLKTGGTAMGVVDVKKQEQLNSLTKQIESVKPVTSTEEAKKQNTAALAIGLAGLGALGVTGGGIAASKEKEKEEEETQEEENKEKKEFEFLDAGEEDQEDKDKKDWLYGLGIGLAAAAGVGKELSKEDEDDEDQDAGEEFVL